MSMPKEQTCQWVLTYTNPTIIYIPPLGCLSGTSNTMWMWPTSYWMYHCCPTLQKTLPLLVLHTPQNTQSAGVQAIKKKATLHATDPLLIPQIVTKSFGFSLSASLLNDISIATN